MMRVFLRAVGCLAAAAAAGGHAAVPKVAFTAGYNNSNCEAHPHAGVELADGGGVGTHANVLSSFQTLCAPCHEDKTARARRDRADVVDLTTLEDEEADEVVDLTGA